MTTTLNSSQEQPIVKQEKYHGYNSQQQSGTANCKVGVVSWLPQSTLVRNSQSYSRSSIMPNPVNTSQQQPIAQQEQYHGYDSQQQSTTANCTAGVVSWLRQSTVVNNSQLHSRSSFMASYDMNRANFPRRLWPLAWKNAANLNAKSGRR